MRSEIGGKHKKKEEEVRKKRLERSDERDKVKEGEEGGKINKYKISIVSISNQIGGGEEKG